MSDSVDAKLELESPVFTCGHCRFSTALAGHWTIEHGRLVFRADADPQPRRGPDLHYCGESRETASFTSIVTDTDQVFTGDVLAGLQKVAERAHDERMANLERD